MDDDTRAARVRYTVKYVYTPSYNSIEIDIDKWATTSVRLLSAIKSFEDFVVTDRKSPNKNHYFFKTIKYINISLNTPPYIYKYSIMHHLILILGVLQQLALSHIEVWKMALLVTAISVLSNLMAGFDG